MISVSLILFGDGVHHKSIASWNADFVDKKERKKGTKVSFFGDSKM